MRVTPTATTIAAGTSTTVASLTSDIWGVSFARDIPQLRLSKS